MGCQRRGCARVAKTFKFPTCIVDCGYAEIVTDFHTAMTSSSVVFVDIGSDSK
jgi:hypothetical protein